MEKVYNQDSEVFPNDSEIGLSLVPIENKNLDYSSDSEHSKGYRLNVLSVTSESSIESIDPFSNLPENWSNYDFNRKKSCLLSSIYSTCVTKAINHLDLLQSTMEAWMKQIERALPESESVGDDLESSKNLINLIKTRSNTRQRTEMKHAESFNIDNNQSIKLSGNEIALIHENKSPKERIELNKKNEMMTEDDLKFGGILEEILVLLARLEFDRRRTQTLLDKERANYIKLKSFVDNLALKRATELPAKVQREHDTCINDITELNWHISFNIKVERKLIRKVEIEERLHEQLLEEITGVKMNLPLIEEKIKIELEYLNKIESAQNDVSDLLIKAKDRMKQSQEKSKMSYNKAAQEREMIKAELDSSKRDLYKEKKRLQETENQHTEYLDTLVKSKQKIEENITKEKNEIAVKVQLRDRLKRIDDENAEIINELIKISKDIERIKLENQNKLDLINETSLKYNTEIDGLVDILNKKLDKMEKILKKVREKEVDIEEMTKDKKSMENKIQKEEKNKQRMFDERVKVEEQLDRIILKLDKTTRFNETTQRDQEAEMKRIGLKEEVLRKQIGELKKQLNEERFKTSTLVSKMNVENEEYKKNTEEYTLQKKEFERKKLDNDKLLDSFQHKIDNLETIKLNSDLECFNLDKGLKDTIAEHQHLETMLTKKITELQPKHESIFNTYADNKQRLDYVKKHTVEMKEKMQEMAKSKEFMIKNIHKTNQEIEELNKISKEAHAKCEATAKLDESSKASYEQVEQRLKETKQNHETNYSSRFDYLNKLSNQLSDFINLNKELASRYRSLKYDMFNFKLNMIDKLETKLGSFVNVRDKREVKLVQEKMQFALKDYYRLKIQASEQDYEKLKANRSNLGKEINEIGNTLQDSIEHVKEFLDNQIDFSLVRQQAMEKVYKQELIDQQNAEREKIVKKSKLTSNKLTHHHEISKNMIKT